MSLIISSDHDHKAWVLLKKTNRMLRMSRDEYKHLLSKCILILLFDNNLMWSFL